MIIKHLKNDLAVWDKQSPEIRNHFFVFLQCSNFIPETKKKSNETIISKTVPEAVRVEVIKSGAVVVRKVGRSKRKYTPRRRWCLIKITWYRLGKINVKKTWFRHASLDWRSHPINLETVARVVAGRQPLGRSRLRSRWGDSSFKGFWPSAVSHPL